jgi:hypothetical protein
MITAVRNSYPFRILSLVRALPSWGSCGFSAPSPHFVKQVCLLRNGIENATWVETGTYLGQTTQLLSRHGAYVYSIEPEATLFAKAKKYFDKFDNVEILNGPSEQVLPVLLPKIQGDVNFWLDGHYSAGLTFKGKQDTPILDELSIIGENLTHFSRVRILIDDIRCFNPKLPEYSTYPPIDAIVDWARKYRLDWHIEHDIFVAQNRVSVTA